VNPSSETLHALRSLIEKTPSLLEQLQQVGNAAQGAEILARAGMQAGIAIDAKELRANLESTASKMASQPLSDVQLNQVAGGMNKDGFIAMSVFTLAIGCAVMSQERYASGARPEPKVNPLSAEFCLGT
jgi:hypothetical protein